MGRHKLDIDPEEVQRLAELQCTQEEMAVFFGCNKSTISRNFATEIAKGKEVGKMSLRRKQFKLADTNAAMAIFLGKNYLQQKDSHEIDIGEDIGAHIEKLASVLEQSYTKAD